MQSKDKIVIFVHGYKGDQNELGFLKEVFENRGYQYLSFKYGKRNKKDEIVDLAEAEKEVARFINLATSNVNPQTITVVGYSLGAAVAVRLCAENKIQCNCLIVISVFDSRSDLLKERGISLSSDEDITPADLVKKFPASTKLFFIHGVDDKSVGINRSRRVFLAAKKSNPTMVICKAGHQFNTSQEKNELKLCIDYIIN